MRTTDGSIQQEPGITQKYSSEYSQQADVDNDGPLLSQPSFNAGTPTISQILSTPFSYVAGKVKPGSVKGSIFNLVVVIVGAGMVSLPYCFMQVGIIPGILILAGGGLMTYFSAGSLLVGAASEIVEQDPDGDFSYPGLALRVGGPKLQMFMKGILSVTLFGYIVSYHVVIVDMIQDVYKLVTDSELSGFVDNKIELMTLIPATLYWPCLMRDLSSLRFSSLFGLACAAYLALVIAIEYFYRLGQGSHPKIKSEHLFAKDWSGYMHVVPICILSYACHTSILSIYNELNFPSQRRMMKVTRRGVFACFLFYVTTAIFGFLTFLEDTKDNILLNDYGRNYAIAIGQICLTLNLALSFPIFVNVIRQILELNQLSIPIHMLLTAGIVGGAYGVALVVPNISTAFEFIGSTTLPVTCYIMPTIFLFSFMPHASKLMKYGAVIACVLVVIISTINVLEKATVIS